MRTNGKLCESEALLGGNGSGTILLSGKKRQDSVIGRARKVDVGGMIYHALLALRGQGQPLEAEFR